MSPETVYAFVGTCLAVGLAIGGFVALFNSWRV